MISTPEVTVLPDGRMDTKNMSLYSGYAEKTLAMKRLNGTGPKFVKQGRIWYYRDDVDEWLAASGRSTSTAAARHRR